MYSNKHLSIYICIYTNTHPTEMNHFAFGAWGGGLLIKSSHYMHAHTHAHTHTHIYIYIYIYIYTHTCALFPEVVPNAVEPQSCDDPRPWALHEVDS